MSASGADKMMDHLFELSKKLKEGDSMGDFKVKYGDQFEYKDPVDGSVSSKQGMRFGFTDGSRFVVRLSGTGSVGATVRLYLEKYEPKNIDLDSKVIFLFVAHLFLIFLQEALKSLIKVALETMNLNQYIGTDVPTVIT